ncbi:MAG: molybdenum cofactor synthesis domain-containing protein, partial [Halobacteriales archaeon]
DELVRPGEDTDLDRGQIYDLNTYAVAAAVRDAGGDPEVVPHVGDDYDRMKATMDGVAARCDLVLSSGSTSASDEDVLYQVVEDHGELHLHGVAVKPGRPTIVGLFGGTPYVGLPGNPVSALSIFRSFVASKVRDAAGRPEPPTATLAGTMAAPLRYSEGRTYLLPVAAVEDGGGDVLVYPVDKGSGAITSLTEADGVVEMAPETERLSVGQSVTVKLFDAADRPPSVLGIGESDPLIARVLDRLDGPRYLGHGTREGRRRLRDGVSDFAVLAGDFDANGEELARFRREWGLVVPPGNPDDVEGLADLPALSGRFVNLAQSSGLRGSLDDRLDAVADRSRADPAGTVDGYERPVNGYMTPAKRVESGDAAAGLGLRFTAESLDVDFVPVAEQPVQVVAAADRLPKPGTERLAEVLAEAVPELLADLPGYGPAE